MPLNTDQQARTAFKHVIGGVSNTFNSRGIVDERALFLPSTTPQINQDKVRSETIPKPAPGALVAETITPQTDPQYLALEQMLDDNGNTLMGSIVGKKSGPVTRIVQAPLVNVVGTAAGTTTTSNLVQYRSWSAVRASPNENVKFSAVYSHPSSQRPNRHETLTVTVFSDADVGATLLYITQSSVPAGTDLFGRSLRGQGLAPGTTVTSWSPATSTAILSHSLVGAVAASSPLLLVQSTQYPVAISQVDGHGDGTYTFTLAAGSPLSPPYNMQAGHMLSEAIIANTVNDPFVTVSSETPSTVQITTRTWPWAPYTVMVGSITSTSFKVTTSEMFDTGMMVNGNDATATFFADFSASPFEVMMNRNWQGQAVEPSANADKTEGALTVQDDSTYTIQMNSLSNNKQLIAAPLPAGVSGGDFVFNNHSGITRFFASVIPSQVNQQFPLYASCFVYSGSFGGGGKIFKGGSTQGLDFDIKAIQVDDRNLSDPTVVADGNASMALQIGGDHNGSWRLVVMPPDDDSYDGINPTDTTFHIQAVSYTHLTLPTI